MRMGVVVFSVSVTLFSASGTASAQPQCPTGIVAVHSTLDTHGTPLGGIHTSDGTVLVTVWKPPGSSADHWTVTPSLVGTSHGFVTAGKPLDEERVDTSGLYTPFVVNLYDATHPAMPLCTISQGLVSVPTIKPGAVVFVLPDQGSWTPMSIDALQLAPTVALEQPFVSFDGTMLHLTGRLNIAKTVRSRSIVDLRITRTSAALKAPNGIPFDIASSDSGSDPYTITLDSLACTSNGTWRCDYVAKLTLPRGITAGSGDNAIALTLQGGVFKLASADIVPIRWTSGGPNSRIDLHGLELDPQKRTIVGTGQLIVQDSQFTLTSFGFARTPTGDFVPTGAIELKSEQAVSLPPLLLTGFSGRINFGGSGDQLTTVSADATLDLTLDKGTTLAAQIKGVQITAPSKVFTNPGSFTSAISWKPDFSHATVVPLVDKSKLFNHLLEPCDPKAMPVVETEGENAMRLCLGLHLGTGTVRNDDDIAYGYATFQPWNPSDRSLKLRSLSFTLPPKQPAMVRFGAGKMGISALRVDVYTSATVISQGSTTTTSGSPAGSTPTSVALQNAADPTYAGFDADIGTARLTALHCDHLGIVGEATIDQVSVGNTVQTISATPRLGFGETCTAFALRGFLPIQLTPQSNMMLTSLAFVHSNVDKDQLDFLNASGSFTSGNITVVFNSIGFRTFLKNDNPKNINCVRELREYEMFNTRVCAIVDVNMPMTLAATGAQNASAIKDAISKAASAIFGFFAGRRI